MTAAAGDARIEPEHIRIPSGAITLAGDLYGPEDGPFVMMTHGGGQTRHSWGGTARVLAKEGYRVLSMDLRGHGDSDWAPDGDYTFPRHAEDVEAAVRLLAKRPAALVGASMGGLASLLASKALGDRVAALVLVDVATRIVSSGADRIGGFMRQHMGGFASLDEAADAVAAYRPERPRPKDTSGLAKNLRLRDGRWYWHWDPAMMRPGREVADVAKVLRFDMLDEAARALRSPVLLVHGVLSDIVDDDSIAILQASVPQLEVAHVKGAGHMVVGDNNAVFETVIIDFLNRVFRN
jgi:pimeloyl-ACP methyl ester carboxylesterase